jgi:hypothetical protein
MSDPTFDYILARSRTRESSILAIASIASSASLILLGLTKTIGIVSDHIILIYIFGILFATFGILYREITKYTIHNNDERWLKAYAKRYSTRSTILSDNKCTIPDPLVYCRRNRVREGLIRALFILPILAWALTLYNLSTIDFDFVRIGGITSLIIGAFLYTVVLSLCDKD